METTVPNQEENLTLRTLQTHIIKAIIVAVISGILAAVVTSVAFYFNTTNNVDELTKDKVETKENIKELKKDVADIKMTLSNTSIYTQENKDKAQNLQNEVSDIKKQQDEMLKLLYEIKSKVK